jgi:hypothetical protein
MLSEEKNLFVGVTIAVLGANAAFTTLFRVVRHGVHVLHPASLDVDEGWIRFNKRWNDMIYG